MVKTHARLQANPAGLWSLSEKERTGGETDIVGFDKKMDEHVFYDCSSESPMGRRSICYDRDALESRKEHKPANNAIDMATAMGIELLTEEQYRELQPLGKFDTKTSSWIKTPPASGSLAALFFVIAVTTMSSYIIMVLNLTTLPGDSVARCVFKFQKTVE